MNNARTHYYSVLAVALCVAFIGCGEVYRAKKELVHRGIQYSVANYLKAVEAGDKDTAALFLKAGMEVDASSDQGDTALMVAVNNSNVGMCEFLLAHGANPNARRSTDGMSPLVIAASLGSVDIAKMLINGGADINTKTTSGVTPLFIAAAKGRDAIVKLLLQNHAKVNEMNVLGWPPLLIAVQGGDLTAVRLLIDAGAPVNNRYAGVTPLIVAAANDKVPVIEELLKRGADVNGTASNGATALTVARLKGYKDAERILVNSGARRERGI